MPEPPEQRDVGVIKACTACHTIQEETQPDHDGDEGIEMDLEYRIIDVPPEECVVCVLRMPAEEEPKVEEEAKDEEAEEKKEKSTEDRK